MSDEIKEIVVEDGELIAYYKDGSFRTFDTLLKEVLDYITNLQEEIHKKEAMYDSLAVDYRLAQEENEYLKMNNPEQNMKHFKIINENKRKINNLRAQNIDLKQENERLIKELENVSLDEAKMNNKNNERITYEEFMLMFRNAPRIAYTLYDKAEDEIDRLNNVIDELEKWLEDYYESTNDIWYVKIINKLKQLKKQF